MSSRDPASQQRNIFTSLSIYDAFEHITCVALTNRSLLTTDINNAAQTHEAGVRGTCPSRALLMRTLRARRIRHDAAWTRDLLLDNPYYQLNDGYREYRIEGDAGACRNAIAPDRPGDGRPSAGEAATREPAASSSPRADS
jgi:hypothetical protein